MKQLIKFFTRKFTAKNTPISRIGTLPTREGSALALVLAKLLSGEKVNALDLLAEAQTSRAKDLIASLRNNYGWTSICSESVAVGTADGRVLRVSQYWLPEDICLEAETLQTFAWEDRVWSKRRNLRAKAKDAAQRAKAFNARKKLRTAAGSGK